LKVSYFSHLVDSAGDSIGPINKTKIIVDGLRAAGHEIHLNWLGGQPVILSGRNKENQGRALHSDRLSRYFHEPKRFFSNVKVFFKGHKSIRQQQPDLIIERQVWHSIAIALLCKIYKIPLIVESAAPCLYEYLEYYGRRNFHIPLLPQATEKFTLNTAAAVFAVSTDLKNHFIADLKINAEKIHVIPNGADPEKFKPVPAENSLIKKYELKDKTVVGWVGSSIAWSGVDSLVNAIRIILKKRPDVVFMFVGNFNKQKLCENIDVDEGLSSRLVFTGIIPHEDLNACLSVMDIMLAPYPKLDFWWASSIKVFEYMAAAKPVIATGVGQLEEIINNGHDGLLLQTDSAEELTREIIALIDNPVRRKEMGRKAREKIQNGYSWTILTEQMSTVINEVLS